MDLIYELDLDIEDNKDKYIDLYKTQVLALLWALVEQQTSKAVHEIGTIAFILSRINMESGLFSYKVKVYGDKIYINTYDFDFSFEITSIFEYFLKAKEDLYKKRRKYFNMVEACSINAEVNKYIPYFNMYSINLLKLVFEDEEVLQELNKIKTYEEIFVIQNEMYEKPYLIFTSTL